MTVGKQVSAFVLACSCALVPYIVYAEPLPEQKLIVLEGTKSRLMKGDDKPLLDFTKDEALPYFLARGWRLTSVFVNEKSREDRLYGYAVLERPLGGN